MCFSLISDFFLRTTTTTKPAKKAGREFRFRTALPSKPKCQGPSPLLSFPPDVHEEAENTKMLVVRGSGVVVHGVPELEERALEAAGVLNEAARKGRS